MVVVEECVFYVAEGSCSVVGGVPAVVGDGVPGVFLC